VRVWNACYFNATREDSRDIQAQLNIQITGDEKLGPFPHWTLSTATSGKRYGFLTEPVTDWFVGGLVAQSMEPWHPPGIHAFQTRTPFVIPESQVSMSMKELEIDANA